MSLSLKQKAFAEHYLQTGNATESALKAGYSENYAKARSSELLVNVGIKAYIDEQLHQIKSQRIADAEEVLKYLTSVMRGETTSEIVVVEGIGEGCSEARRVDKAPDEKERLKAAELLGKRYRLFTDNVDINANVGVTIVDDV